MQTCSFSADARSLGDFDVVVIGGGPAGVAASIAASREGARCMLIESSGCLGGAATNSLVSVWLGSYARDGKTPVVAGIFGRIVDQLVAMGAAKPAKDDVPSGTRHVGYGTNHGRTVPFEFEPCKLVLDRMVHESGVTLRLFSTMVQPEVVDGRISRVFVHGKSGFSEVRSKAFVDASGDADVAFLAGCPTVKGRDEDGLMTPASMIFIVEDADSAAFEEYCKTTGDVRFRKIVAELKDKGEWPFDFDIIICCEMLKRGRFCINTLRQCGIDGTDEESLTRGMVEGREQSVLLLEKLRRHVPGFASVRMTQTSAYIGIRETRRIVGEYVLANDDIISGRHFDDTIALSGYQWDLPDPKKPSFQPMEGTATGRTFTEIPYRCLVPQKIGNLIVAGRCVSTSWNAMGPLRIMPACFAMGEAAGIAAARVSATSRRFLELDTQWLRHRLTDHGAIIDIDTSTA